MKKKIIVLAVVSALSIPTLTFADTENVVVYGRANVSYDMVNTSGSSGVRTNQVSSNASHFGLKGSEELGDGWTATWQIEQIVRLDNSTAGGTADTLASRNSFINLLNGQYGIFILGRHDTPYKIVSRTMDVFFDTIADNRSLMGGASLDPTLVNLSGASAAATFDGKQGNVAAYISPAIGDLMLAGAYVTGAETATTSGQIKGDAWSFAGLYTRGSLNVNLGYEVHNLGTVGTGTLNTFATLPALADHNEKAWKLAVSYALDAVTLYGVYERTKDNFGDILTPGTSDFFGHKSYYLAGKYRLGSDTVMAAFTNSGDQSRGANTGAKQWSLGYDHKLSRRTSLYALYTQLNNDSAAQFNLASPDASSGYANASAAGADPSAFSVGMKHRF